MTICVHKFSPWRKFGTTGKRTWFLRQCKNCPFEQRKATTGEKPKD